MFNNTESLQNGDLFDGRYKLLRKLSSDGATADVWLALDNKTIDTKYNEEDEETQEEDEDSGMVVAIKIYRPKNALDIEGEQRFRDEFKIAYDCHHTNLLQPTSFSIFNGIPYLVLPYCKLGSSEQLIGKSQSKEVIWKFILDVSSGLAKLHSNEPQIIHQDIKPANILIDNSHHYTITDFGISSQSNKSQKGYYDIENSGTLAYMAPERFNENTTPTPASDIWSFGATLCEILTGKVPYGEEGGKGQSEGVAMTPLKGLNKSFKKLIKACLQKDPKRRPTAEGIVKAAQAQQFPTKRKLLAYLITLLAIAAVFGLYYAIIHHDTPSPHIEPTPSPTVEEVFALAYQQLNSADRDTASHGLHVMDSLSRCQYIPAMNQVALTYGWLSEYKHRKEVLGIELDEKGFLPKLTKDKTKAKDLFESILDLSDTTYADINARTAFRLAGYYGDPSTKKNEEDIPDVPLVLHYLGISEKWVRLCDDSDLLSNIDSMRKKFYNYLDEREEIAKAKGDKETMEKITQMRSQISKIDSTTKID